MHPKTASFHIFRKKALIEASKDVLLEASPKELLIIVLGE